MDGGPATIHDLQQEVLEVIFKKLEEPDLVTVQNVCRRWSYIVDKRVGRRLCVGNPTRFWLRVFKHTKVGLEELSQIGIQSCSIFKKPDVIREEEIEEESESEAESEAEDDEEDIEGEENEEGGNPDSESGEESESEEDSEDSDDDDFQLPDEDQDDWESPSVGELKYPYLLRELKLHGSLPPDVFARLVRNARNLSVLEITLFTLANLRKENLERLVLPNLKELEIKIYGMTGEDLYRDSYEADCLLNLKTLLTENQFPRLTLLRVDLPPASFTDLSITSTVITFVQNHYALQQFLLRMYYTDDKITNNIMPEPNPATHHELRTIIDGIRKRGECHLSNLFVLTRSLEFQPIHEFPFPGPIEIINEFLRNVSSLECLSLTLDPIPSSSLQTICERNSTTLQELYITNERSNVDCSVFASLKNVESIILESLHGIDGITQLPASLREIQFEGYIHPADASHILFDLPNMRRIFFDGMRRDPVNPRDISCVTLDMLNRFNENRRVDSLYILGDCIVNPEVFPPEGIPNNDPTNPEMLQVRPSHAVWWKLNEDGFYSDSGE